MTHLHSLKSSVTTIFFVLILSMTNAQAALDSLTLSNNINELVLQGNELLVRISGTELTTRTMSFQIDTIETEVDNYQTQINQLYNDIVAENGSNLTLTGDLLLAFQNLSTVSASLANATQALGLKIAELSATTPLTVLESSLTAMLRLADDIGTMADRINEMADKILIMADNIVAVAELIVATQIIQSDNLKLVISATLETQTNIIQLMQLFL